MSRQGLVHTPLFMCILIFGLAPRITAHDVANAPCRYRLVDGWHLLAEVRFNEFFGAKKDVGVGFGLQYHF